jgi:hypothetical protein
MDGKLRHRPTTFMGVQDLTRSFLNPKYSNNEEVRICPAVQTLFSVQPISRVLEVQMISNVYPGKMRQFPRTFMIEVYSGTHRNTSQQRLYKFCYLLPFDLWTSYLARILLLKGCGSLF